MSTKAVIYARASTDAQDESCAQQIKACKAKAKELGLTIADIYEDDGISGQNIMRPKYQQMLTHANSGEFKTIIMWKLSRLGRDSVERERATRLLEAAGLRLVTVDGYDTTSDTLKNRKLIRGFKGLIDETFIDDLREEITRGQIDSFEKGFWLGGRPYGYKLVAIQDPKERDAYGNPKRIGSKLAIDKAQAKIVLEIFTRYGRGESPQSIAADLNERRIPSPGSTWKRKTRRCTGWARSAIWQMLPNELYTGTYYWRKRQYGKSDKGTDKAKFRDRSEWMGKAGNAPELAIVPPAIWKLARVRYTANNGQPKNKRLQMGGKAVYMLSGLLFCGVCGAHYVIDSATHYSCAAFRDGRGCKNDIRVRRDLAEQVIIGPIKDELLAPEMVDDMAKEMERYYAGVMSQQKATAEQRPAEVAALDARIEKLRAMLKADPDMADELQAGIEKAEAKRVALLAETPTAKRHAKILAALPGAAKQYRDQITKGLQGNPLEAGRGRVAVRQLIDGGRVDLKPKGTGAGRHLVAHYGLQRAALLGVGFVGRGDRI